MDDQPVSSSSSLDSLASVSSVLRSSSSPNHEKNAMLLLHEAAQFVSPPASDAHPSSSLWAFHEPSPIWLPLEPPSSPPPAVPDSPSHNRQGRIFDLIPELQSPDPPVLLQPPSAKKNATSNGDPRGRYVNCCKPHYSLVVEQFSLTFAIVDHCRVNKVSFGLLLSRPTSPMLMFT